MANIETVNLDKIKPDKRNARRHSDKNIAEIMRSLEQFGQHRPFVVQRSTGKILVGNGMHEAMKRLGWGEGQVLYVDDNDATATKRALADNRTAELAEWDDDMLKELVEAFGPDPDIPGWTDEELADMFDLYCFGEDTTASEDDAPEVPVNPASKAGDIWLLGDHRLICGDSCDRSAIGRLMGDRRADMVFTDPPYNVNYAAKNEFLNEADKGNCIQSDIENDNFDTDEEIGEKLWKPVFTLLADYAHDHCSIYVTMPQGGAHMMMMMMIAASWQVKHELIWVKNNHVLGRADYYYKHEPIMFGWKKKHYFYGKGEFNKSVWEIDKPLKNDLHPTMKPVKLIENALLNSSKKGDVVMDFFGGSGSTLIACEQTERVCYMCELSPSYVDVIVERWQNLTGKEAIHAETGEQFNKRRKK